LDDWGRLAHDPLRSAVNADDIQAHDQDDRRAGPPEQRVFFDSLARAFERFAEAQDQLYRPWLSAVIPNRAATRPAGLSTSAVGPAGSRPCSPTGTPRCSRWTSPSGN
jgi:hypothetical protein